MLITEKMKKGVIKEIKDYQAKGYKSKDILRLFCKKYGIPEDVAIEIFDMVYNEGFKNGKASKEG